MDPRDGAVAGFNIITKISLRRQEKKMRRFIATVAAVGALGLTASVVPATAQHHASTTSGAPGSAAMGRASGPVSGAPSANFAAPSRGNFSAGQAWTRGQASGQTWNQGQASGQTWNGSQRWNGSQQAWRGGEGRHDGDRRRDHDRRGFVFGFGVPYGDDYALDYGPDYGPDYTYDDGNDYGNSCYALRRTFYGGYWHTRRVWICG